MASDTDCLQWSETDKEWARLQYLASEISPNMSGRGTYNFLVSPYDEPSFQAGEVFVRAKVLKSHAGLPNKTPWSSGRSDKVLLKFRYADWVLYSLVEGPLKILNVGVSWVGAWILDATPVESVVVGTAQIEGGTKLTVAEFFSGAFMGWSQAAYLLHRMGVPISASWGIEVNASCVEAQQKQQDCMVVANPFQMHKADMDQATYVSVLANVEDNWWMRMLSAKPVNVAVVSAPSLPWSRAAEAPGLSHPDGRLLLRMADICGTAEIPVVVLEQVEGFPHHPHFDRVCRAWALSGYSILWQETLDAIAVLPAARKRHIMVMRHQACAQGFALPKIDWQFCRPPTLRSSQVLVDLPPSTEADLVPTDQVWEQYIDPWLLPQRHVRVGGASTQATAIQYRVREGHQTASCFAAQYRHQHELPQEFLERRGLLGQFIRTGGKIRFFAGAEIALTLGAVCPVFLSQDSRQQYKGLGNAISVPHAALGLLLASAALKVPSLPSPEDMLCSFAQNRMTQRDALFVPSGGDWILCPRRELPNLLNRLAGLCPTSAPMDLSDMFLPITLQAPDETVTLQVASSVDFERLLQFLGLQELIQTLPQGWGPRVQPVTIQVLSMPRVTAAGLCAGAEAAYGLSLWLTPGQTYVMDCRSPLFWPQVVHVVSQLDLQTGETFSLYNLAAWRLKQWETDLPCCVVRADSADQCLFPLAYWSDVNPRVLVRDAGHVEVQFPNTSESIPAWLGMPFQVLSAAGWSTNVKNFPPKGDESTTFHHQAKNGILRLRAGDVAALHRLWLVVAGAERAQATLGSQEGVPVDMQVVTQGIWQGYLPPTCQVQDLEALWSVASHACAQPPACRVFSGPFPCPGHHRMGDLQGLEAPQSMKRKGRVLITFHPSVVGGGAKAENGEWTSARVASMCLGKGCPLQATTQFVEQIVAKVGVGKIMNAIGAGTESSKWAKLTDLAQTHGVAIPVPSGGQARAADRVHRAAQRKKGGLDRPPKASEVCVEAGFFVNEDNTPTTVLEHISPGATGVLLVDLPEAAHLCNTLEGVQPDELALLVLGHECPDSNSCDGVVSFPAVPVEGEGKVLLAGCLHNFGGRKVRCMHSTKAEVELSDVTCCQFLVFADEIEASLWKQCAEAPVRFVSEALRIAGIQSAFTSPWGRTFTSKGRPAVPLQADSMAFHARVEADRLTELLKQSGQGGIYVVPKSWDRSPHSLYAIVWTGPHRADVATAALKVPEQLGIVRSKAGFGASVPESAYAKVYSMLKAGAAPPPRVQVSKLFRVGPIPQKAGAREVQAWADKCSWQVRVIKALGPGHWLLGSPVDPPSVYPAFNGQTVLIQPVRQKGPAQAVLQSGTLPTPATVAAGDTDPWLQSDPWKAYRAARGLPTSSKATGPVLLQREVTGPTEKRFQEQEGRLTSLEQALQQVQADQSAFRAETLAHREQDRQTMTQQVGRIEASLTKVQTDLAHQLQTSITSLVGAQAQQQAQMQAGIDELRSLISEGFHKRPKMEEKHSS